MPSWNKVTQGGRKVLSPGLVARRAKEMAMFRSSGGEAAKKSWFATEEEERRNEGKGPNYDKAVKMQKSASVRDPFGVQLTHPSFQPVPAPPPKALKFSGVPAGSSLKDIIKEMSFKQRMGGATGGTNIAAGNNTININGVAPGREALMAKKTALALRDPIAEGLRQLKEMKAQEARLGYV